MQNRCHRSSDDWSRLICCVLRKLGERRLWSFSITLCIGVYCDHVDVWVFLNVLVGLTNILPVVCAWASTQFKIRGQAEAPTLNTIRHSRLPAWLSGSWPSALALRRPRRPAADNWWAPLQFVGAPSMSRWCVLLFVAFYCFAWFGYKCEIEVDIRSLANYSC